MSTWPSSRNKPSATMVSPSIASITLYISVFLWSFFLCDAVIFCGVSFLDCLIPVFLGFRCARSRVRGFFYFFYNGDFDRSVC
jgi:hypothetical protein